jgi:hypothetical protein
MLHATTISLTDIGFEYVKHRRSHRTRLILAIDTIRPRHLLGHLGRNRATRLPQILRPPLRNQSPRTERMLCHHGPHLRLVHLRARQMDQLLPPPGRMPTAEQKLMHSNWLLARFLQRHHPLRTHPRHLRYRNLQNPQNHHRQPILAWILVSFTLFVWTFVDALTYPKLYCPSCPAHRLRHRHLRRRLPRPHRRLVVARMLLAH